MSMRNVALATLLALALMAGIRGAWAQQAKGKPAATRPASPAAPARETATQRPTPQGETARPSAAQPAAAKPAAGKPPAARPATDESDAARKQTILNSSRWRRAIFELTEWLSAQTIYDKQQVAEIKSNLSHRVARMSADELEFMLDDMDEKFKVMETPQAQDARTWLAQYLSVVSDKKREEVLKEMPNLVTMTAAQLAKEINKIEAKRSERRRAQTAFDRARTQQVDNALAQDRQLQQAAMRDQEQVNAASYYSPYRSQPTNSKPFQDVQVGPSLQIYSGGFGGPGVMFSPSSW